MSIGSCLMVVACTQKEEPAKVEEKVELPPVKIAVVGPHSGDLASYGIPTTRAAELVVEHRNALCGINEPKN